MRVNNSTSGTTVGLFVTNQQPVGRDLVDALEEQLVMVRLVRDRGWDAVFTGHHYLTEASHQLQPVPFLARIAAESGDLKLGIGILLLTLQNPVAVAEEIASLDIITGGRVILGVGLGYRDIEFNAFGVHKGDRVYRFENNLRVLTDLWKGGPVDVDLPWCHLEAATPSCLPIQQPRPPIWVGGTSDPAVRRAARLADAWIVNPAATYKTVVRQRRVFDQELQSSDSGGGQIAAFREVFCAETRELAVRTAAPFLLDKYASYQSWGQSRAHPDVRSFEDDYEELQGQRFIVGSPDDCLRKLLRWRDELGVSHFLLRTHWTGMPADHTLASIELLSEEVVPQLQQ